jgi:DNA-binding MarR family transcriptional regulator
MPSSAPTLNTQVIGQAESALGAILRPLLEQAAITFHQWIVLVVTSARGGSAARADLVWQLTTMRKLSDADVLQAIEELVDIGLVELTGGDQPEVRVTAAGQARYRQVREQVDAITGRIFGNLPLADLETAARVLGIVTARANAELATAQN